MSFTLPSKIQKICQHCKKEFLVWRCSHEKGHGKFCGLKCRNSSGFTIKQCQSCGIEFKSHNSNPNKKYCSSKCYHSHDVWSPNLFWSHVSKTDSCWIWNGSLDKKGYGQSRGPDGGTWRSHRVAWFLMKGYINHDLFLCHHCDNPKCVNPDHLFEGTNYDNVQDMIKKGRNSRGSKSSKSKLLESEIRMIRFLEGRITRKQLSLIYNTCRQNIDDICNLRRWKHIT